MMASSAPVRRPLLPLLSLALLLLAALSSHSVVCAAGAAVERHLSGESAMTPAAAAGRVSRPAAAAGRVSRQEFHVPQSSASARSPAAAGISGNGGTSWRPVKGWRRRARRGRGGGTGAWTFSAMLPRGFVPPSGSSACHNGMPATAAEAEFFACGGAASP